MDNNYFLQEGHLTKSTPFIIDLANSISGHGEQLLQNIFNVVRSNLKASASKIFPQKQFLKKLQEEHLRRPAEEIIKSGYHYGCDEYAVVFATLARLIGIPTKYIQCAEIIGYKNHKSTNGHVFLECFIGESRYLVDSTRGTVVNLEQEKDKQKLYVSHDPNHSYLYQDSYSGLDSWEAGVRSHQEMIKRLIETSERYLNLNSSVL